MVERISVIVPVHNESAAIGATARALLDGLPPNAEVVFACNGCTDDSVEQLRAIAGARCRVLELPQPGKTRAIREAERSVTAFPRFYVDSDVLIAGEDLSRLAAALEARDLDLVSPRTEFDLRGASWAARAVNEAWLALPHGASGGFHAVLGVSRRGRARWGEFPDVMADDAFIEAHMAAERKAVVADVAVRVRPPWSFWSYIRMRERCLRGDRQLRPLGLSRPRVAGQRRALATLTTSPRAAAGLILYLAARLTAQVLSMLPRREPLAWYRDQTSRKDPR